MKYLIKETKNTYVIYSIASTNFGGDAKNWIADFPKEELQHYLRLLEITDFILEKDANEK